MFTPVKWWNQQLNVANPILVPLWPSGCTSTVRIKAVHTANIARNMLPISKVFFSLFFIILRPFCFGLSFRQLHLIRKRKAMKETFFHMRDTIRIIPANACISVFLIFIPRNRRLWNLSYQSMKKDFQLSKNRTAVTKEERLRQRRNCTAIDKEKAARLRAQLITFW